MGKILLTGANGFIAAHILKILLERGHSVVGTVRSKSKADQLYAFYPSYKDTLSFVYIPDLAAAGCWDDVIKSTPFDYVLHTASPYSMTVSGTDLLDPAIEGTKRILNAVKKYGSTVKRVVITGSFASYFDMAKGASVYTEEDWNPVTYEDGLTGPWLITYFASKKFAEKAAWEFLENEKPDFDITVLTPPIVLGPVAHHVDSFENTSQSTRIAWDLITDSQGTSPPSPFWLYIDVRDLALAHVLAFEKKAAGNQRILVSGPGYTSYQELRNILRERLPEIRDRVPEGNPDEVVAVGGMYQVDVSKSVRLLGIEYRSAETMILDTARNLLAIEERQKAEAKI